MYNNITGSIGRRGGWVHCTIMAYPSPDDPTLPYLKRVDEPVKVLHTLLASKLENPSIQIDPHFPLKKTSIRPAVRFGEVFSFVVTSLIENGAVRYNMPHKQ